MLAVLEASTPQNQHRGITTTTNSSNTGRRPALVVWVCLKRRQATHTHKHLPSTTAKPVQQAVTNCNVCQSHAVPWHVVPVCGCSALGLGAGLQEHTGTCPTTGRRCPAAALPVLLSSQLHTRQKVECTLVWTFNTSRVLAAQGQSHTPFMKQQTPKALPASPSLCPATNSAASQC